MKEKKVRFWRKKAFWIAIVSVAIAVAILEINARFHDKALVVVSVDSYDASPDYQNGKGIDFRRKFDLRQEREYLPAEENGWRILLQAFGPNALEQRYAAERIPWEDFPTNEDTKVWFETYWTPACNALGLEPTSKPTFLNRLDLVAYLIKNGITGKEGTDEVDIDEPGARAYWEGYEEKVGLITSNKATECYMRLLDGAWTTEDYPNVARWIEENADLYDVYAQAVRMSKFRMWHKFSDEPFGGVSMLLPDVQHTRDIARKFAIRANYRIGVGNFSGAIDDIESILILASRHLGSDNSVVIEQLVGVAIAGIALRIGLEGNHSQRPTKDDYARLTEVLDNALVDYDPETIFDRGMEMERDFLFLSFCQDVALLHRKHGYFKLVKMTQNIVDGGYLADEVNLLTRVYEWFAKRFVFVRGSIDDASFMRSVESCWYEMIAIVKNGDGIQDCDIDEFFDAEKLKTPEKNLAKLYCSLLLPALSGSYEANRRLRCAVQMYAINVAMMRYQIEHGTLPPAFTTDSEGKPLQSWRVLLLPYLGEEADALHKRIRLNEPWDSEYNKQFHNAAPSIYSCPSNRSIGKGQTAYSVILGEESLFDASGVGKDFNALRANSTEERNVSRQALIVERRDPVGWMRPDVELDVQSCRDIWSSRNESAQEGDSQEGVGAKHFGGMQVALAGGDVVFWEYIRSIEPLLSGVPEQKNDLLDFFRGFNESELKGEQYDNSAEESVRNVAVEATSADESNGL